MQRNVVRFGLTFGSSTVTRMVLPSPQNGAASASPTLKPKRCACDVVELFPAQFAGWIIPKSRKPLPVILSCSVPALRASSTQPGPLKCVNVPEPNTAKVLAGG